MPRKLRIEYPGALYHGIQEDTPAGQARFEQWRERRRLEEMDLEFATRGRARGTE